MGQILGYSKFKSKKGNDCVVLKVLEPATPYDNQYGRFGNVVKDLFVPVAQHGEITEKVVGHEVIPQYNYGFLERIDIK